MVIGRTMMRYIDFSCTDGRVGQGCEACREQQKAANTPQAQSASNELGQSNRHRERVEAVEKTPSPGGEVGRGREAPGRLITSGVEQQSKRAAGQPFITMGG